MVIRYDNAVGKLDGRVAIVTGGARGMGEAHARALLGEGARVVIGDVLEDAGGALADGLGDDARFVALDVADETSWQEAVAASEEAFGPVSILINNAGVLAVEPIAELALAEWRRVLDTNLTGAFLGMKTVHPSMKRAGGGAIVNVSSMAAYIAVAPASAYTASKWGLRGLTKAAALEFGPDGIRVNSIHPGMIMTPMIEGAADEATQSARYPIPRFGRSEEVATTMLHIVCDATYSTGSEFCVDGGILAGIHVGD
jgi:3alpha(or 20beta)-hydroxysteroid dehydrogenase